MYTPDQSPLEPDTSVHEMNEESACKHCGAMLVEGDSECRQCGIETPFQNQNDAESISSPERTKRFGMACGGAAAAAVISGACWGALGVLTNMEYGWIACLIGIFVGWVVSWLLRGRSVTGGLLAVLFALIGIFIGKAIIAEHSLSELYADELMRVEARKALFSGTPSDKQLQFLLRDVMIANGALPDPNDAFNELGDESGFLSEIKQEMAQKKYESIQESNQTKVESVFSDMKNEERAEFLDTLRGVFVRDMALSRFLADGRIKAGSFESASDERALSDEEAKKQLEEILADHERLQNETMKILETMTPEEQKSMETHVLAGLDSYLKDELPELRAEARILVLRNNFKVLDIFLFLLALVCAYQMAGREKKKKAKKA